MEKESQYYYQGGELSVRDKLKITLNKSLVKMLAEDGKVISLRLKRRSCFQWR